MSFSNYKHTLGTDLLLSICANPSENAVFCLGLHKAINQQHAAHPQQLVGHAYELGSMKFWGLMEVEEWKCQQDVIAHLSFKLCVGGWWADTCAQSVPLALASWEKCLNFNSIALYPSANLNLASLPIFPGFHLQNSFSVYSCPLCQVITATKFNRWMGSFLSKQAKRRSNSGFKCWNLGESGKRTWNWNNALFTPT